MRGKEKDCIEDTDAVKEDMQSVAVKEEDARD